MSDDPRDHISALNGAPASAADHLVDRMLRRCWPGGAADRIEPAAVEWLRRWAPSRAAAAIPACSCAQGRCATCN